MPVRCQSAILLCTNVATQQCAVCGRFFCGQHGDSADKVCWRCKRDYERRLDAESIALVEAERRQMAADHNAAGHCGWAGCADAPLTLCQRCGLKYCGQHSNHYNYSYRYRSRRGIETRRAQINLCDACKDYLGEYKKEKSWLDR